MVCDIKWRRDDKNRPNRNEKEKMTFMRVLADLLLN